jgi:hypothetical protein
VPTRRGREVLTSFFHADKHDTPRSNANPNAPNPPEIAEARNNHAHLEPKKRCYHTSVFCDPPVTMP